MPYDTILNSLKQGKIMNSIEQVGRNTNTSSSIWSRDLTTKDRIELFAIGFFTGVGASIVAAVTLTSWLSNTATDFGNDAGNGFFDTLIDRGTEFVNNIFKK